MRAREVSGTDRFFFLVRGAPMVHRTFMNNKVVEGRFPANEGCLFWFGFFGGVEQM